MARAQLLLLLVAVLAMGSGAAGSAPPESTPEPEEDEVTSWPFILISVILVLSISFETVKELIEHHTPHVFEPITDAFFGELATLGFIGAIAFTLTYNFDSDCHGACSVMQRLSDKVLGEPEALQEVFELLHFMLFAISVVFIFVVLALLSMTLKNAAGYEELEQMINDATTEAAQRNGRRRMSTPSSPTKSGRGKSPDKNPSKAAKSNGAAGASVTAGQWSEETTRERLDAALHYREDKREAEAGLMQQDARRNSISSKASTGSKPSTPNPLDSLMMWGSDLVQFGQAHSAPSGAVRKLWWKDTMFEHWFKPRDLATAEYFRLRHRFIDDEEESVTVSIPHDLDFGVYLKKTLAHTYAHIIEIAPTDWGVLWLVMGAIYLVYYIHPGLAPVIFAVLELLLLLLSWAVLTKLIRIRNQLISPMVQQPETSRTGYVPPTPLLDNIPEENRGTAKLLLDTQAREDSDAPHDAANNSLSAKTGTRTLSAVTGVTLVDPPYLKGTYQFYTGNTLLERTQRLFYGKHVNRHQALFWFGAKGPHFMMHMTKLLLFTSVVNLATFIVNLRPQVMALDAPIYVRLGLCFLALAVPALTLFTMPVTIGYLNLVTCIESMKKEHELSEVIKEQKHARHQKAMQVLASLQFFLDQAEMLSSDGAAATGGRDVQAMYEEAKKDASMTSYLAELENLFFSFDKDKSGSIDEEELGDLLECMGQQKTPDELHRLFNLMDADDSKSIEIEEFCTVMLANRKARRNIDPVAIAEKMYGHFDADGDGTIEPEEMLEAFQKMGQNWDMAAIRDFLLAIDADGSGTIEKEEFITFVAAFVGENQD